MENRFPNKSDLHVFKLNIGILQEREFHFLKCAHNTIHAKTMNYVTFQDRRQGESGKPALVRQEPVKDAEKSADGATNRG